jgi:hypothetical protein
MALSQFDTPAVLDRTGTLRVEGGLSLPEGALQDTVTVSVVVNQDGRVARGSGAMDGSTTRWAGTASGARLVPGPAMATGLLVASTSEDGVAGVWTFAWSVNIDIVEEGDAAGDAAAGAEAAVGLPSSASSNAAPRPAAKGRRRRAGYPGAHGSVEAARLRPASDEGGRYGRMFPGLAAFAEDTPAVRDALMALGSKGGDMDARDPPWRIGDGNGSGHGFAGWTFFGQFVDHDVTFDPTSSLERKTDPGAVRNYRTPALELDSVYGSGPVVSPHLYDQEAPGRFLLDPAAPGDVPRNSQGTAIIGDPRNDANLIVSQLHLAFLKLHNALHDQLAGTGDDDTFARAQQLVRWHYQWIVLHEYLPAVAGSDLVDEVVAAGPRHFRFSDMPFLPAEMSVGAFRYGHSQLQPGYVVNLAGDRGQPFGGPVMDPDADPDDADPPDLAGGHRAPRRYVDWPLFFPLRDDVDPQRSRAIDTKLASPLFELAPVAAGAGADAPPPSLAQRNLRRHLRFGLPAGEQVAEAMGVTPLTRDELPEIAALGADLGTPLWFYILREAELAHDGRRLGAVGGRILVEVLVGLLQADRSSYLAQQPDWRPEPPLSDNGELGIADLLRFAGVTGGAPV